MNTKNIFRVLLLIIVMLSVVQAVTAASAQSKHLLIQSKSPLLLVETIAYDQDGIPIEFGRSYYRADRYEYRVQLN